MGLARNFAVGLPKACGVPEGLAEIYAEHIGKLFDYEVKNPSGHLQRDRFGSHEERLFVGLDFARFAEKPEALTYAVDLMVFALKCRDAADGADVKGLPEDRAMLEADEADFPDVAAMMSVEQASTMTSWN